MDDSPIQTALCVIGHPIGGNPTQFVVARVLASFALDWQFLSFDVAPDDITAAIAGIDSLGFCGAMIAEPYQTEVARLIAAHQGDPLPTDENAWHDFLIRDQDNRLILKNLGAEALQNWIDSHVNQTGRPIESVLIVCERSDVDEFIKPFLPALPMDRQTLSGSSVERLEGDVQVADPIQLHSKVDPAGPLPSVAPEQAGVVDGDVVDAANAPDELLEETKLVTIILWAWPKKHSKKLSKKPSTKAAKETLDTVSVAERLGKLHADSICIDMTGTASSWFNANDRDPNKANPTPFPIIDRVEWDVRRLALAIHHWTNRDPNIDAMREAIEEYLEV